MYTAAMMAPPIEPYVVAEPRATRRLLLIAEVLLYQMVLTRAGEHNPAAAAAPPANVYYWPLKNATSANGAALSYEERALALAFQGIVNAKDGVGHAQHQSQQPPTLFFDAGALDFDWSAADQYWHDTLEQQGRVQFTSLKPTLCALLAGGDPSHRAQGLVGYPSSEGDYGDGYSLAIALTVAGQQQLLPVDEATLKNNPCIGKKYSMKYDLRTIPAIQAGRTSAWSWAYQHLLPPASKNTVYNLWRYREQRPDPDPQRNATAATIDYAVQQKAFVLDHQTHLDTGGGPGMATCSRDLEMHPQTDCSPHGVSPWLNATEDACRKLGCCWHAHGLVPTGHMCVHQSYNSSSGCCAGPDLSNNEFVALVFQSLEPLFSAYGWSYEYSWTNLTSIAGGAVFCSFATPNLSFWSLLPLPQDQTAPRKLPVADSKRPLDKTKRYVTFVTNEGDTPRIVDSLFGAAWADHRRGSVPVAWAIDPVIGDQFPALWDYYAASASANDSFVAGVGGGGYVFLNTLSSPQFKRYAQRVGRLLNDYGPSVVDTYGFADPDLLANYSVEAALGGVAPSAYISEPTHFGIWDEIPGKPILPYSCNPTDNRMLADGKTPLVCTPGSSPWVFYFASSLNASCPSCDFAERIKAHAETHPPPYFITTYGALHWTAASQAPLREFWTLLHDTMARLGDGYVAVGADEMARLAAKAVQLDMATTHDAN